MPYAIILVTLPTLENQIIKRYIDYENRNYIDYG